MERLDHCQSTQAARMEGVVRARRCPVMNSTRLGQLRCCDRIYGRAFEVCLDTSGMKGIKLLSVMDDAEGIANSQFHPYRFSAPSRRPLPGEMPRKLAGRVTTESPGALMVFSAAGHYDST